MCQCLIYQTTVDYAEKPDPNQYAQPQCQVKKKIFCLSLIKFIVKMFEVFMSDIFIVLNLIEIEIVKILKYFLIGMGQDNKM